VDGAWVTAEGMECRWVSGFAAGVTTAYLPVMAAIPSRNFTPIVAHVPRKAVSPLAPDAAALERFLGYCHRRRYPPRTDVFRPGDPAGTLYYVVNGSVSIITEEDDDRELVLGYFGVGEFVGEMGLFIESDRREVILRTRSQCELGEISYERLYQLFDGALSGDATKLLYAIGAQLSRRLLDTSRKAGRLAFLDVTDRIIRTLHDLTHEPEAMSHPQGTQLRVSRQELARLVGCSREMAGRVLKKLQIDGVLHARGKTVVLYGTR
jgi:CRP/FNR family transcriptional regulator, cyclic AMP receptor protein